MVGISSARYAPLVKGDEWVIPIAYQDAAGAALNGAGFTLSAAVDWYAAQVPVTEVLDDEDDDRTGILWTDQSQFEFKVKVNETETVDVLTGKVARLIVYYVDTKGDRYTMLVLPLEVISP